ncbi:MAG: Flp family type IVb pilin [Bdellovibrionales bacterium]|jgi:Flp pilus assembly pilin Flp
MMTFSKKRFWGNAGGATAIEYAFIAAMICVAIVGVVLLLGTKLGNTYQTVVDMF